LAARFSRDAICSGVRLLALNMRYLSAGRSVMPSPKECGGRRNPGNPRGKLHLRRLDSGSPAAAPAGKCGTAAMQQAIAPVSVFRLRFIDMARAVAILLMLEGHFVDVTLADEWRVRGNPVHDLWLHLRGLAAPMFFTVTGVIFSYLLGGATEPGFFRIRRVRRGLLRAGELLFWGYLLQVDLGRLPAVLRGAADPWLGAFHVLQCIAVGLLVMILLYAMARSAGPRVLAVIFVACGFALHTASILLANHPGYLPADAPAWLQNPIRGPRSSFPLAPWLGFTLYGAAIGALLRTISTAPHKITPPAAFLIPGLILKAAGWSFDRAYGGWLLDLSGQVTPDRIIPGAFHGRIGETLVVLGVLVWIENRFRPNLGWLQTIGRNTFPIYVSHVILLYGGIFGIGLNDLLRRSLNPWQAAAGAIIFCAIFGFAAQWVEALVLRWRAWRSSLPQAGR